MVPARSEIGPRLLYPTMTSPTVIGLLALGAVVLSFAAAILASWAGLELLLLLVVAPRRRRRAKTAHPPANTEPPLGNPEN